MALSRPGSVLAPFVGQDYADPMEFEWDPELLAPDARAASPTDEAVNEAVRSLIHGRSPA